MKERPILFSGPMVQAILDGRKTQTRRVMKLQPGCVASMIDVMVPPMAGEFAGHRYAGQSLAVWPGESEFDYFDCHCPYGAPGDRLWVREAWAKSQGGGRWPEGTNLYRADHGVTHGGSEMDLIRWKPSIHMPRCASRITLEITDIRVERLQEISGTDVRAEGVQVPVSQDMNLLLEIGGKCAAYRYMSEDLIERWREGRLLTPERDAPDEWFVAHFASLWESINGADSWEANPWVWVVEFRRVEA